MGTFLPLTTLAKVKLHKGLAGPGQDPLIEDLILEVSDDAQKILRRHTEAKRRTEVYELPVNQRVLSVDGFPISGSVTLYYAPTRDFTGIDVLDTSDYQVIAERGQIEFSGLSFFYNPGYVQIIYTGGMASDTAAFILAEPRIAGACTREVINRLNRAASPEGNVTSTGSQLAYHDAIKPLEDFENALNHKRRISLWAS